MCHNVYINNATVSYTGKEVGRDSAASPQTPDQNVMSVKKIKPLPIITLHIMLARLLEKSQLTRDSELRH